MVTNAVEYAGRTREWAGTATRNLKQWGQEAEIHAEDALAGAQEALGRTEEVLSETWRTTTEIATRASARGERAVRDAETRTGLLLGAAMLAIGGALFIALRSNREAVQADQQPAVALRRVRAEAYRV